MSIVKDVFGGGAEKKAAKAQTNANRENIAFQKEALAQVRGDLQPFRETGGAALNPLAALLGVQVPAPQTAPQPQQPQLPQFRGGSFAGVGFGALQLPVQQTPQPQPQTVPAANYQSEEQFLRDNPLLRAVNNETARTLFANQAASGKLGSGGTLAELQQRFLANSLPVLQNRQANLFNLAALGQNAAAQQGTATQNTAANIGNSLTNIGDAKAAGIIGRKNAIGGTIQGIATGVAMSDVRQKEDVVKLGTLKSGINIYSFRYKHGEGRYIGVMAQQVEKIKPEAIKVINGIKHVDYTEIEEWPQIH